MYIMAKKAKLCGSLFAFLFLFSLGYIAHADDPVTIFILGDSTVDVGTNNWLPESYCRADFSPNGVDLPYSVPTGRFSNGLNSADQIVRLFGYQRSPPPFLYMVNHPATFKRDILRGVNFASAGAGIFYETGQKRFIKVVPLSDQIQQFATVKGNLTELIGPVATANVLAKSLFIVSIGSNDLFEHVPSNSSTLVDHNDDLYITNLQFTYHGHLENLYMLGARKFGIIRVPPIGCCPNLRASSNKSGDCREDLNKLAQSFFISLKDLLRNMSSKLEGMKYSLGNAYEMTMSIIEDPLAFGIKDVQSACCGSGKFNGELPCFFLIGPNLCANRREYLLWDSYHPTEYASELAALTLYGGGTRFVTPMNFSQLVATHSYVALDDFEGVKRVPEEMEMQDVEKCSWSTYNNLASIYVNAELFDKAEQALKMSEEMVKPRSKASRTIFLISLNAGTSNLGEVNGVWKMFKQTFPATNNISYLVMLQALCKLNHI